MEDLLGQNLEDLDIEFESGFPTRFEIELAPGVEIELPFFGGLGLVFQIQPALEKMPYVEGPSGLAFRCKASPDFRCLASRL